jgi:hypothetical protein
MLQNYMKVGPDLFAANNLKSGSIGERIRCAPNPTWSTDEQLPGDEQLDPVHHTLVHQASDHLSSPFDQHTVNPAVL